MAIISSYVFWIIVSAIVVVLALIGYLAEGTEFANKALNKKNKDLAQTDTGVVKADLPVEVLKVQDNPSAWAENTLEPDKKMETAYKADSIDDWMNMPNLNDVPKIEKEDVQKAMDNSDSSTSQNPDLNSAQLDSTVDSNEIFDDSQEMFPDIKPDDLEPIASAPENTQDNEADSVWK